MTAPDAQDHLDSLARDVASPVPPGLLHVARTARRRRVRGRLAVVGGAAAVAAVALAVTLPGATTMPPSSPPAVAPITEPGPAAPPGTRWVSQAGWMVAVPGMWQLTGIPCSSGDVVEDGPGFYYLQLSPKDCRFGAVDPPPSVGILLATGGSPAALDCDPSCSQTVVDGPVELRVRSLDTAEEVTAITDTLQPVPDGWLVDPVAGAAGPRLQDVPGSRSVTELDDVMGDWIVTDVVGGPVPADADRRLTIGLNSGDQTFVRYSLHSALMTLTPSGGLVVGQFLTRAPACRDGGCDRPGGFDLQDATRLRLTPDGDMMLLLGPDETVLAVYARAQ